MYPELPYGLFSYHRVGNQTLALLNPWAFQLRKVMALKVQLPGNQTVWVGALMPPFAITTIELTMTLLQAGAYYEVHEECAAGFNLRFESDKQNQENSPYYSSRPSCKHEDIHYIARLRGKSKAKVGAIMLPELMELNGADILKLRGAEVRIISIP